MNLLFVPISGLCRRNIPALVSVGGGAQKNVAQCTRSRTNMVILRKLIGTAAQKHGKRGHEDRFRTYASSFVKLKVTTINGVFSFLEACCDKLGISIALIWVKVLSE